MKRLLIVALCSGLAFVGCKKRKTESGVVPIPPSEPTSPAGSTPAADKAPPAAGAPATVNIAHVEAGVEFGDLNNVIASFEERNKRLPTIEELKKAYYGGTRPIPIPPGYHLVIDPKGKKARLVPGN